MKKYMLIYQKYRHDILNGYLKYQQQLPSIRESCQLFKASKTTIEHAYNKLCEEGYVSAKAQVGYFVTIKENRLVLQKQYEQIKIEQQIPNYRFDFRSQTVSLNSFEMAIWKRYLKEILDEKNMMATYGDSQGELVLRQALCQYAYQARGVLCHPQQILVGSNYQSLLSILAGLMPKNSVIAMEALNVSQAKRVFDVYGLQVVFIASKEGGIDLNDLEDKQIDFLYLNSACQGLKRQPISLNLKEKLLELSQKHNFIIIEDDYNGELNYVSKKHYALHCDSQIDNVIYCGSFSRLLLPSFRISYLVFNQEYNSLYHQHKNEYGPTASKLEQLAFCRYIEDGYLSKHVKKLKKEYKEKNQIMLKALTKYFKKDFVLNEAYLCYQIKIPAINEKLLLKYCQQQKMALNPPENHYLNLSFASLEKEDIMLAVKTIYEIIKSLETKF